MIDRFRSMHLVIDDPMTIHLVSSKNKDCENDLILKGFCLARVVSFSAQDKRAFYNELEMWGKSSKKANSTTSIKP